MVRARSGFAILLIVSLFFFSAGFASWFLSLPSKSDVQESWHQDAGFTSALGTVGVIGMSVFGLIALLCLAAEIGLRTGWEPKFWRKTIYGAIVVEKRPEGFGGWMSVQRPDGTVEHYLADSEEYGRAHEGDVVKLEVTGEHIAEIKVVPGETAQQMAAQLKAPGSMKPLEREGWLNAPGSASFIAWLFAIGLPLLAGHVLTRGAVAIATKEIVSPPGRRSPAYLVSGDPAAFAGWVLFIGGLVLFGLMVALWVRGWNDETFPTERGRYRWW